MGPPLPLKNNADVIVWAHLSCLKMLAIILNGPTAATENTAFVIVWAHLSCLKMLLIILNGPTVATENTADVTVWAHLHCQRNLSIILNGPTAATAKYCQCYCMGPFKLPNKVAHNIEWASTEKLPMVLCGPSGGLNRLLIMTNVP